MNKLKRIFSGLIAVAVMIATLPTIPMITLTANAASMYNGIITSVSEYWTDKEWEVLQLTNKERMSEGLLPLSTTEKLQEAAHIRAIELTEFFDHARPDGRDGTTVLADLNIPHIRGCENIAAGSSYRTPDNVMYGTNGNGGWINSPGHRANIMNTYHNHIGIGNAYNATGQEVAQNVVMRDFWVQLFPVNIDMSLQNLCHTSKIEIGTASGNPVFTIGNSIEDLGLFVILDCSCGIAYMPLISEMCSGYNANSETAQTVTVTYGELSTTFSITLSSLTVTFDSQGGSAVPPKTNIISGNTITAPPSPTKDGNVFRGWFAKFDPEISDFGGKSLLYESSIDVYFLDRDYYSIGDYIWWDFLDYSVNKNITLYALWESKSFAIAFNANGGSVNPISATTQANGRLTNLPTPTRNGFTFNGWFSAVTGGTPVNTSTVFTETSTIYAQWTAIIDKTPTNDPPNNLPNDPPSNPTNDLPSDSSSESPSNQSFTYPTQTPPKKVITWYEGGAGNLVSYPLDYYITKDTSTTYNPELAELAMAFSRSSYNEYNVNLSLENHGFKGKSYKYSGVFNIANPAFVIAEKPLDDDGNKIVAIIIKGTSISNPSDDITDLLSMIGAFEVASINIFKKINELYSNDDKITYFVTGHSYGGAVACLVAGKLNQTVSKEKIFAYTFASPNTGLLSSLLLKGDNVFNVVNTLDTVPKLPPYPLYQKNGISYKFTVDEGNFLDNHSGLTYLSFLSKHNTPDNNGYLDGNKWAGNFINYLLNGILCPVDVDILDSNDVVIARFIDNQPIYLNGAENELMLYTIGDEKYFISKPDNKYTLKLMGTDSGEMDYFVQEINANTNEVVAVKNFENVSLYNGKEMIATVGGAVEISEVQLFLANGDEIIGKIMNDGTEIIFDDNSNNSNINNTASNDTNSNKNNSNDNSNPATGICFHIAIVAFNGLLILFLARKRKKII